MKRSILVSSLLLIALPVPAGARGVERRLEPPIDAATVRSILNEASGENAYEYIRSLASFSRYPNSEGFHRAAEYVAGEAKAVGLSNVRIESFEVEEPSWDYTRATLRIVSPDAEMLADTDKVGVALCRHSHDADVEAYLVDVGPGTRDRDYAGRDVEGKIVLASGFPRAVQRQAVQLRGAVGFVSYYSPSFFGVHPSEDAVAWQDIRALSDEGKPLGFGFMLSPRAGRTLAGRLARMPIRVHAVVKTRTTSPGRIEMVTAEWKGSRPAGDDIVFSAHLDHQRPGANDNASGSAALLEIARTLRSLLDGSKVQRPRRTIRFWWVTEIRGTALYFNRHPEEAGRIAFNINIDQAGGDKQYRNDLVSIRTPIWLPTFVGEVFETLCESMRNQYADVYHRPSPLFVAPTGRQDEPLTCRAWEYAEISDHIVFDDPAIAAPSVVLAYPSFHYIHTSLDSLEHIDRTTLKRSVVLGAVMGLYLATPGAGRSAGFESEVAARIERPAVSGRQEAFALIASAEKGSIHRRFFRAVALVASGTARVRAALQAFERQQESDLPGPASEDTMRLLRVAYEKRCRDLDVDPFERNVPKGGVKYQGTVPVRTVGLGAGYREWTQFFIPGLDPEVNIELKGLIDGRRSVTEIWQALVARHPEIRVIKVVNSLRTLSDHGWVSLETGSH
ncbi:MAG: M28 family peptidase [Acidobacteriota bacterium]